MPLSSDTTDTANGDYGAYLTWPEIKGKIAEWARMYPGLMRVGILGKTYEGRDIPLLRISNDANVNETEPEVLLMAGIHPREQQPQTVVVRLIDDLLSGYNKDERLTRLVNERQIWIIPVLNVDGKVYDMKNGDGKRGADWRKNRKPGAKNTHGVETFGVDLNRNFGIRWGGNRGTSATWNASTTNPEAPIYEGVGPLSEPEAAALARFIQSRKSNLRAFLDIHSPLNEIMFPNFTIRDEYTRFKHIADTMQAKQKRRYPVDKDARPDTEPPVRARSGDTGLTYTWAYYTQGVYAFNLEIASPSAGTGVKARYAPPEEIEDEWRDNLREPLLYFIEAANTLQPAKPGKAKCEAGQGMFTGKLTPGANVQWTPPHIQGECAYAVLVCEQAQIVVQSEYRKMPLQAGFTLEVDKTAKPGATVQAKLYLWDKNRGVSIAPFTFTVE